MSSPTAYGVLVVSKATSTKLIPSPRVLKLYRILFADSTADSESGAGPPRPGKLTHPWTLQISTLLRPDPMKAICHGSERRLHSIYVSYACISVNCLCRAVCLHPNLLPVCMTV